MVTEITYFVGIAFQLVHALTMNNSIYCVCHHTIKIAHGLWYPWQPLYMKKSAGVN